ncbi:MAG: hypothetical protein P4M09_21265 [Devosia sp.]|nr:hypothetical protein [Devosia sp.]
MPEPEPAPTPVAIFRYRLDWQDALAYERLPRDLPGLQKITLYIWLGLAGILLIALPPELVGEPNTPRFWLSGAALVLLQYLIFVLLRGLTRLNRARYRYPAAIEMVLTQWPDRLLVETDGKGTTVPFEEIGALLPTAERLFIAAGGELVVVPASALGDAAGMQQLVDAIDGYMAERHARAAAVDVPPSKP